MFGKDTARDTNSSSASATPAFDPAQDMSAPSLPPLDGANAFPPAGAPDPATEPAVAATSETNTAGSEELLSIKQEALQQLSPLVGHLDQTPEEKFRTTMMMIQASDDQSMIRAAYDAAKQIADEKTRAQALLDIVNEINYFTQHNK